MRQVRLGLIGCGSIAKWAHLPVITSEDLQDRIKLVAICDINQDNLKKVAKRYNITHCYTDYQDLLRLPEIDAVDIAVRYEANYEIISQAVRAGKHIFVEKPMTPTLSEAIEIANLVRKANIKFQVGFMKRFYFANRKAKELIQEGILGDIEAINTRFWAGGLSEVLFLENGIHIFDLVQYFGGPVSAVYALANIEQKENVGSIGVSLQYRNGAIGTLFLTSTPIWNTVHERMEIVGKNRKILVSENGRRLYLYSQDEPTQYWEPPQVHHQLTGYNLAGFAEEFKYFAESIIDDLPSRVDVETGIYSIRLKEGIEQSIRDKKVIDLERLIEQAWR